MERAKRFAADGGKSKKGTRSVRAYESADDNSNTTYTNNSRKRLMERFEGDCEMNDDDFIVIGVMEEEEKDFLRLTVAPEPEDVRPERVLHRSYARVMEHWEQQRDYVYACNQFKSMRQDLTIQHIKNAFALKVYETHARISVEVGDLSEYNQCQTQIMQMYDMDASLKANYIEFLCYRILYFLCTQNATEWNKLLMIIDNTTKAQEHVAYCFRLRKAIELNDYYSFFKILERTEPPFLCSHILKKVFPFVRNMGLKTILAAYKPTKVDVSFIQRSLGFSSGLECIIFLTSRGMQFCEDQSKVDTTTSAFTEHAPEETEEKKPAHGVTHADFGLAVM